MNWVWTWSGKSFGYVDGQDLWTYDGRHVGKLRNSEIYGMDGRYLGEIQHLNRLLTKTVYAIEFERKSDPSTSERKLSTIVLAKSKDEPTLDIVYKLVERLYAEDVVKKTVLVSVAKEWEQRAKKGVRVYDLDQE